MVMVMVVVAVEDEAAIRELVSFIEEGGIAVVKTETTGAKAAPTTVRREVTASETTGAKAAPTTVK